MEPRLAVLDNLGIVQGVAAHVVEILQASQRTFALHGAFQAEVDYLSMRELSGELSAKVELERKTFHPIANFAQILPRQALGHSRSN